MQTSPYRGRASRSHSHSSKQRRSGYEPSDTETEFQESPWHDQRQEPKLGLESRANRRFHSSRYDHTAAKLVTSETRRRHASKSPYKPRRDDTEDDARHRDRPSSKRSVTAPRPRPTDPPPNRNLKPPAAKAGLTGGEINERAAAMGGGRGAMVLESMDSISPGDIFFSREWTALALPKIANAHHHPPAAAAMMMMSSSGSAKTTESARQFTANRRKKSQKETTTWFGCVKKGTCRTSTLSPERQTERSAFNEAVFIEKAFVVQKLKPFWADKYRPTSFDGFTCHKQEAQILKHLVSGDVCPHILLKGPNGSGKKSLAMALLREIYGDESCDVSYDLRHFQVQENRPKQVMVPITSSAHHLELNVHLETNAKYALLGLVREITKDHSVAPEISTLNPHSNYKVIVLYEVDKATDENIQHLIKWILDCYTDACKLILCCEDDSEIIESVTDRCKAIKIDAPITHEIMEVLFYISRKEGFDLPMGIAAKIAIKSKQNLRKAIMALESCKAHNYPFVEDQPISIGWEEDLVEISAKILGNPTSNTLFLLRGRLQKLLAEFVHPKLILRKLVEQFLKGIDSSIRRELYYWHAYYDKRLPMGPSAVLKLEEFVTKLMSIYRRSSSNRYFT